MFPVWTCFKTQNFFTASSPRSMKGLFDLVESFFTKENFPLSVWSCSTLSLFMVSAEESVVGRNLEGEHWARTWKRGIKSQLGQRKANVLTTGRWQKQWFYESNNSKYKSTMKKQWNKTVFHISCLEIFFFSRWLIKVLYKNKCADSILSSKYKSDEILKWKSWTHMYAKCNTSWSNISRFERKAFLRTCRHPAFTIGGGGGGGVLRSQPTQNSKWNAINMLHCCGKKRQSPVYHLLYLCVENILQRYNMTASGSNNKPKKTAGLCSGGVILWWFQHQDLWCNPVSYQAFLPVREVWHPYTAQKVYRAQGFTSRISRVVRFTLKVGEPNISLRSW